MASKAPLEFSEGPNRQRQQHGAFTKDILTPSGAPIVARHRVRLLLTPMAVRLAIIEDAATKPEAVRTRSLRRRLTPLDRALSDRQAEFMERLTSIMNGLSNVHCVDYLASEVRTPYHGRLPFGERRRQEIAAMTFVLQRLNPANRAHVVELAQFLDPSISRAPRQPNQPFIEAAVKASSQVVALYEAWMQTRKA